MPLLHTLSVTYLYCQEIQTTLSGKSLGNHGLGAAGGAVHENPPGWGDSHPAEGLWVSEGPLHSLF